MELSVSTPSTQFSIQFSNEEYGWLLRSQWQCSPKFKVQQEQSRALIPLPGMVLISEDTVPLLQITKKTKKIDWFLVLNVINPLLWKPDPSFLSDKKQVYSSSYQDYETATRTINSIEGSKWG